MRSNFKEAVFQAVTELDLDNTTDEEILRLSISAEESAINLYTRLARATSNEELKKILLHVAEEEKVHVGEFQSYLFDIDFEEGQAHEEGYNEVNEIILPENTVLKTNKGKLFLDKETKMFVIR